MENWAQVGVTYFSKFDPEQEKKNGCPKKKDIEKQNGEPQGAEHEAQDRTRRSGSRKRRSRAAASRLPDHG